MRILLMALGTALVLRTGVLQFFVTALSGSAKSSGGSAGATSAGAAAAAASTFLVPGLRRRLLSPAAQWLTGGLIHSVDASVTAQAAQRSRRHQQQMMH